MITMGGFSLPSRTIREMICASIDVIVQAARLRDGSRRITHITEVMGMEGDTIITQDVFLYDMIGEDANRQDHRAAPLDRDRTAAVLGARALFRRREATCGRARCRRSHRAELRGDEHADARTGLHGRHRDRRRAWVFIYPLLSGEKKAESRRASIARSEPAAARQVDKSQRSRREQVEGSLKELDAAARKRSPSRSASRSRRPV